MTWLCLQISPGQIVSEDKRGVGLSHMDGDIFLPVLEPSSILAAYGCAYRLSVVVYAL